MSEDRRKEKLQRQSELEAERRPEEPAWREIARLFRPDHQDFDGETQGNKRDTTDPEIFDATPIYALDDFVGGLFGQGMNPTDRWFGFGVAEDPDLAKWGPVKAFNWSAANQVFASLAPSVSNFYTRAPAWIANLGGFGVGPFYQEEEIGRQRLVDKAIPVGESYIARDAAGIVNEFNRKFVLTGKQAEGFFQDEKARGRHGQNDKITFIHAVGENPDYDPRRLGSKPWASCYFAPEVKDFYREDGYFEFPYHVPTWAEKERSAYGSGPGHTARSDAAMLQEMERSHIVRAQFEAEPPWLLHDESALTAADIHPNAVLYGTVNEQGKQLAIQMERRGNAVLSDKKSEERRAAIRMAFRFSMMQVVNRPQMTLGEFSGWKEQELKLMAPNLMRLQTQGLAQFVWRRFRILQRAGQIGPIPAELTRRHMTVEFQDPLTRVQKFATAREVLQAHGAVEQIAVTDPSVRDYFDGDVAVKHVVGAFTDVPGILRDPAHVEEIRQQRAQALAAQRQLEQTSQAVETAAIASHAIQAKTLADQRGAA